MKKTLSGLCAMTLALSFAATSFEPAQAVPLFPQKFQTNLQTNSDVTPIRDQRWGGGNNGNWHNNGNWNHRRYWRNGRYWNNGNYYGNNSGWGIGAGLLAGALITGIIVNSQQQPRAVYSNNGDSHVQWCYNRYRSYRVSDNTFQPYNGARRQCYSPY